MGAQSQCKQECHPPKMSTPTKMGESSANSCANEHPLQKMGVPPSEHPILLAPVPPPKWAPHAQGRCPLPFQCQQLWVPLGREGGAGGFLGGEERHLQVLHPKPAHPPPPLRSRASLAARGALEGPPSVQGREEKGRKEAPGPCGVPSPAFPIT